MTLANLQRVIKKVFIIGPYGYSIGSFPQIYKGYKLPASSDIGGSEEAEDITSTLTHDELLEVTKSSVCTLMSCDPLLSDLPTDIRLEEILAQIAVEHGQSITITISREEEQALKVIVPQNATVRELKKAVARHFEFYQQRIGNKMKISWKYIWRTYDLSYDSLILDDDQSSIDNYGVTNKVTLTFKKKRKKIKKF